QRRTLTAVAEGDAVFSERVRTAYELGPSSILARSLDRLRELSFVARERTRDSAAVRYRVVDPFLRAWVLRGRPPGPGGASQAQPQGTPPPGGAASPLSRRSARTRRRR